MRQKRAKAYKRLMNLYSQNFGFRSPFQVLVGHDFLLEQANMQLDLSKMLSNCVQGECKPMITQCSVEALYKLGKEYQAVTNLAKNFERRRCNHREPIEEHLCIKDVVGETNKHRYILAVQHARLRSQLRMIPGVPIAHFNERGVLVMELPSEATLKHKEAAESAKLKEQMNADTPLLANIIGSDLPSTATSTTPARQRKQGPKAPNPLSQRSKKSAPLTGRISKKELAQRDGEKEHADTVRGKKRLREEDVEETAVHEKEDAPERATKVKFAEQEKEADRAVLPVPTGEKTGGENEGAQKKRKRKRRKKGIETEGEAAGSEAEE